MKVMVLNGLKESLKLDLREVKEPIDNQVLVKLKAAAFNRRDYWITQGQYPRLKFPIVLGSDGAGIVVKCGQNTDNQWINKEIIINPSMNWKFSENPKAQPKDFKILGLPDDGTFSEYILIDQDLLFHKPQHLDFESAASIPLAGLTAFRSVFTQGKLKSKEKILITGVGGGVALFAFLFAVHSNCDVFITSGKDEKIEKAIKLGAKGGVNYKIEGWNKELNKLAGEFDLIIDSACGPDFVKLVDLTAPGGRIVFPGGTVGKIPEIIPAKIFWKQMSIIGSTMGNDLDFSNMINFINDNQIQFPIDTILDLEEAQLGMEMMANNSQFGKIVLKINE